jgi:predicted DsbA family dithiol-disulfide isomerase
MTRPIQVDAWLDIACPWCWISKRRFTLAVEDYGGDVEVDYHSFELAPNLPDEYLSSESEFLQSSYPGRTPEQIREMMWLVTRTGARLGLVYDFDAVQHTNTLRAHQLFQHAKVQGVAEKMLEALFSAFFERGRDLRRMDELAVLAGEVGLNSAAARNALESGHCFAAVVADRALAATYGVISIPTYVFERQDRIYGARRPAVIAEALRRAAQQAGMTAIARNTSIT